MCRHWFRVSNSKGWRTHRQEAAEETRCVQEHGSTHRPVVDHCVRTYSTWRGQGGSLERTDARPRRVRASGGGVAPVESDGEGKRPPESSNRIVLLHARLALVNLNRNTVSSSAYMCLEPSICTGACLCMCMCMNTPTCGAKRDYAAVRIQRTTISVNRVQGIVGQQTSIRAAGNSSRTLGRASR